MREEVKNLETYLSGKTIFKSKYHYRAVMEYPFEIIAETMNELSAANFMNYDFLQVVPTAQSKDAEKLIQVLPTVISTLEKELAKLKYG